MPEQQFRIYGSINPIAHAGDTVTIDVSQTLTPNGGGAAMLHTKGPTLEVQIQGPQVQLSEADIVGVYPAASSTNSPDNYLPHMAISRRTLPWERVGPAPGAPWLALLLLTDVDMRLQESPLVFQPAETVAAQNVAAQNVLKPVAINAAIAAKTSVVSATPAFEAVLQHVPTPILPRYIQGSLTPTAVTVQSLQPAGQDPATYNKLIKIAGITAGTTITTLAVPAPTLKMLLPAKPADLALLCNAKEVIDPGSNPTTGTFTSLVVGSRLPDAGDGTAPAPLHTAVLVSLEQRDDIWTRLNNNEFITLIVLHSWTFTPSKGGDFREVCQMLRYGPNGGVMRFGNLPAIANPANGPLTPQFNAALDSDGYLATPLDHAGWGEDSANIVWRGPLRPFPPPARSPGLAIRSAPEEFTNQPSGTKLDYSHSTAFELGRLLAIANAGIREDLRQLHQVFNIPNRYFVAQSDLPGALQRPYWGIDQGESLDVAQQQLNNALANAWQSGQTNLAALENAAGKGDFTGVAAIGQSAVAAGITQAAAQLAPGQSQQQGLSQIDIGVVEATLTANLELQFPELVNAGF